MAVSPPKPYCPYCHTFVSYFQVFQMSAKFAVANFKMHVGSVSELQSSLPEKSVELVIKLK